VKTETEANEGTEGLAAGEGRLLYSASAILRKAFDQALAPWGITSSQASVLAFLEEVGHPITINQLARLLILESPSVTTMIDRLSEHGLVERTRDPKDRRKTLVRFTQEGKRLLKSIREPGQQLHDEMFDVLTDEERQVLRAILRKFRDENMARLA
jgi:DNA-binding MarR family transcriptional regulator